ncbi:flagellar basal body-associated FliL family protein [Hydrogenophaga sp.]|uniref:flagellar basal body-associated FliL family protein n=1 Tax=Hydrogenophaga sp. TaxID=1904254 RepID=UPI0025B8D0BE|nr:flagellar basal body-associated FliL family protein [Hydrogenophaga sp.]
MSAAAQATADSPAKPKSKKLLFIIIGVVVLALLGAGGALFVLKKNTANEDGEEDSHVVESKHATPKTPPVFVPLENMVVNLADAGGNRFVQVGITLQVQDSKTSDDMKTYMPSIRSDVLLLISQRTAEDILSFSGKEKLAGDIVATISGVMGYELAEPEIEDDSGKKKRRRAPPNPLQGVLFSSFIVQ